MGIRKGRDNDAVGGKAEETAGDEEKERSFNC